MSDLDMPQLSLHVEIISVDCEDFISGDISADVRFKAQISSENGTWNINKSFKETKSLHKKLKKDPKFRGIELVKPPDPSRIFAVDVAPQDGMDQIQNSLREFLHQICHRNVLYTSNHVQRFLKTPKLVRRHSEELRRSLATPLREGYMTCRLDESSPEQQYYCQLFPSYSLAYYEDETSGKPIGVVDLSEARRVFDFPKQDRFAVECGTMYMFTCASIEEKKEWFQCFRDLLNNPSISPFITEMPKEDIPAPRVLPVSPGRDGSESDVSSMNDDCKADSLPGGSGEYEENKVDQRLHLDLPPPGTPSRSQLKDELEASHERECCLTDEIKSLQAKLELLQEKSEQVRKESSNYQKEHGQLMDRCAHFEQLMDQEQTRASGLQRKLEEVEAQYQQNEERWNFALETAQNEVRQFSELLERRDQDLHNVLSTHLRVQIGTLGKIQGVSREHMRYDKVVPKRVVFISKHNTMMWSVDASSPQVKQCVVTDVSTDDDFILQNITGNRSNRWFKVTSATRILVLLAKSRDERDTWVSVIRESVNSKKRRKRTRAHTLPDLREIAGSVRSERDCASDEAVEPPDRPVRKGRT